MLGLIVTKRGGLSFSSSTAVTTVFHSFGFPLREDAKRIKIGRLSASHSPPAVPLLVPFLAPRLVFPLSLYSITTPCCICWSMCLSVCLSGARGRCSLKIDAHKHKIPHSPGRDGAPRAPSQPRGSESRSLFPIRYTIEVRDFQRKKSKTAWRWGGGRNR